MGGEDLSASTELSGAADPLRLTARHEIDLPGRVLALSFVLYNRLPTEVSGVTIRCPPDGPPRGPLPQCRDVCFVTCKPELSTYDRPVRLSGRFLAVFRLSKTMALQWAPVVFCRSRHAT